MRAKRLRTPRACHRLALKPTVRHPCMAQADEEDFGSLMAAANRGDTEAYARLLHGLTTRLRYMVRRQVAVSLSIDVEDIVQDVLLSMHSVRATYDPARPFMPWLVAIVRRRIVDNHRRWLRQAGREVELDEGDVTFAASATNIPSGDVADVESLRLAMSALPPGQRQAIELLKIRELSLREASAATGLSVGALKVAVHRAIAALRVKLKNEG